MDEEKIIGMANLQTGGQISAGKLVVRLARDVGQSRHRGYLPCFHASSASAHSTACCAVARFVVHFAHRCLVDEPPHHCNTGAPLGIAKTFFAKNRKTDVALF